MFSKHATFFEMTQCVNKTMTFYDNIECNKTIILLRSFDEHVNSIFLVISSHVVSEHATSDLSLQLIKRTKHICEL